jgi:hypothetical protein
MSQRWFKCFPSELLNEIGGMPPDAGLVYLVTYMRVFDTDGPVADDASVIARRIGLSPKRAAVGLEWLIRRGKIEKLDVGYDIPATRDILADRRKRIQDNQIAGKESARSREQKLLTYQRDATSVERPFNNIREDKRIRVRERIYKRIARARTRAVRSVLASLAT